MRAQRPPGAGAGAGPQDVIEVGSSEAIQGNGETPPRQELHHDARALSEELAARIEPLCRELLPAGVKVGPEWRCGSVQGEPGNSLGVRLKGDKAGIWCDFNTGEKGDALELVKACLGLDTKGAMDWARSWLGHRVALSAGGRHGPDELAGAYRAAAALGVAGRALDLGHDSVLLTCCPGRAPVGPPSCQTACPATRTRSIPEKNPRRLKLAHPFTSAVEG